MTPSLAPLDGFTVRDQWAEIADRADQRVNVVALTTAEPGPRRSRAWRIVAASLAAAALLLGGLLLGRATAPTGRVAAGDRILPTVAWGVGPATSVESPDFAAQPLLAGVDGEAYAAFRGGNQLVVLGRDGAAHGERFDAEIAAISAGHDAGSGSFAVVLTRPGGLLRVDASGRRVTLAELGPISSSSPSVEVAQGTVFVTGNARGGLLAVDATRGGPIRTVGHIEPTILAHEGDVVWALDQTSGQLARVSASERLVTGSTRIRDVVSMSASSDGLFLARPSVSLLTRIDRGLEQTDLAQIQPTTTSVAAGPHEVWLASSGVVSAYTPDTGRLIGVIGRSSQWGIGVAFDGDTTWLLSSIDGLRRVVRTS